MLIQKVLLVLCVSAATADVSNRTGVAETAPRILPPCESVFYLVLQYGLSTQTKKASTVLYEKPSHVESRISYDPYTKQEYFYRAMTSQEASLWVANTGNPVSTTGQPWASYEKYSEEYLGKAASNYPSVLIEAHAPGWLTQLASIGILGGKAESGDISWATGASKTSNSFKPNKATNKNLKSILQANIGEVTAAAEAAGVKLGKTPGRNEAQLLQGILFKQVLTTQGPTRGLDVVAVECTEDQATISV
jgi:hypothetical protein